MQRVSITVVVADPTFIQKLWNRGVDISAAIVPGTITAAIVAAIATLTWRYKRSRDLDLEEAKQRQHNRIERELTNEKHKRECQDRVQHLASDRCGFVEAFAGLTDEKRLLDLWDSYGNWLRENEIYFYTCNQRILTLGTDVINDSRIELAVSVRPTEISRLVAQTELPPIVTD